VIRDYDPARDRAALRECFAALQDFERGIEGALPAGAAVADAYVDFMLRQCAAWDGWVLVAEEDGRVVGFVCTWARVPPDDPAMDPRPYAHVSDLVVLPAWRGRGIGRALLARAEAGARGRGAHRLRIGVLAGNERARRLYASLGFREAYVFLAKPL
jgi:ribosomal protein S18 acetylase RimI-like enzyme